MRSQIIVKSNIFDKINNYISIDMVKHFIVNDTRIVIFYANIIMAFP